MTIGIDVCVCDAAGKMVEGAVCISGKSAFSGRYFKHGVPFEVVEW